MPVKKFVKKPTKKLRIFAVSLALLITALLALGAWHPHNKQPQRSGTLALAGLSAPVQVDYDERGVPHIRAGNEADLYRALGYVHAQDRLFQMEILRRLAQGELAAVLGPKLLASDKLFRSLGIRARAATYAASMDLQSPAHQALTAYLDGINHYQATRPVPLEFDLLGIKPRPFTAQDTVAVSGYLAYSFAAAFRTEPALTFVRDKLGASYLRMFDLDWHPEGVLTATAPTPTSTPTSTPAPTPTSTSAPARISRLTNADWQGLARMAEASQSAMDLGGLPLLEGSNAWAISGTRTASGKPMLAGDPHIAYASPSVWYEAHLSAPGFELYGHHQALNPVALLGHNTQFGWSITMFQNDDLDLIAEKVNPDNPQQVWYRQQWVELSTRSETIEVKGQAPVTLTLRRSPHGPIINDAFKDGLGDTPVAMWWAFLETENPVLDAFYQLNRANTLDKARAAARKIHAPGLNVVWASASGDIGWWAAAKVPLRPAGVNPAFILDAGTGQADKLGYQDFKLNPQEENPARGYIVSANFQPQAPAPVSGYYNLADRGQRLNSALAAPGKRWDTQASQALQLDSGNGYGPRVLRSLLPVLQALPGVPGEKALLDQLARWDGNYSLDSVSATVFSQLLYEVAKAAMADEMGQAQFTNLLRTRALDTALPRLMADASAPWWDNRLTAATESRADTVLAAWKNTLAHLEKLYGKNPADWTWGRAHTLTHVHPLGRQAPLDLIFNTRTLAVPGGRETPNNLSYPLGPAPWAVIYGPSTRRVIDFADASRAVGINPVGQSGVWLDPHANDQVARFAQGAYVAQHLSPADVRAHTKSTLSLLPLR